MKLPAARRVEITDTDLVFYDRHDNPVFRVDQEIDLLLIAADLAGKKRNQAFINPDFDPRAAVRSSGRSFDEELKKITLGSPAVVLCRVGGETVEGVLLDHSSFHYRSMSDSMQMSAASNFRTIIKEAGKRAKSCIADHGFSATTLARITYDENSSKHEVLANLGRYTNYMLAAAEAGLIHPDGKMAADFTYKPPHGEAAVPEAGHNEDAMTGETLDNRDPGRPKPPPPLQHSGIFARVFSAPHEVILALLFLLAPSFASVFIQAGGQAHPVFWETATGLLLIIAGLGLFPYGLFVLNYKRMVENTPTSKVRSMAMGMVEVTGQARPEKTGSTVAEKIRKELNALKKDKKRLMAYDTNGDGRVDLDEWETARRDVENRAYAEMLSEGASKDQAVIGKPPYGMLPFIIADSEEGITRKLGFRVWIFLGGGMLCFILGVQMLAGLL